MDYRNQQSKLTEPGKLPTLNKPSRTVRFKQKLNLLRPVTILPYRGHGTSHKLQIKGRIIESAGKKSGLFKRSKTMHNFFTTLRSLSSNEIAGALVEAEYRGNTYRCYSDNEGYFLLNLKASAEPFICGWHEVKLTLIDSIGGSSATAVADTFVPPSDSEFAIISDIDDTVLKSSAFNKIQQIKLTLFKDAASRNGRKTATGSTTC